MGDEGACLIEQQQARMSAVKHLLLLSLAASAAFAFPNVDSIIPEEELMGTPTDDFDEVDALAYRMLEHIHQNQNDLNLKDPNTDFTLEDAQGLDLVSTDTRYGNKVFKRTTKRYGSYGKKAWKRTTKHMKRTTKRYGSYGKKAWKRTTNHVAKAAGAASSWMKKKMAKFCRWGFNTAARRVVKKLFKQAHRVCTRICLHAAGKVVMAGGGSPAGAKAGALIGTGCAGACYAAKRALQYKMSQRQLTSQCFANWCCNKIGKPMGWPRHSDGCASNRRRRL